MPHHLTGPDDLQPAFLGPMRDPLAEERIVAERRRNAFQLRRQIIQQAVARAQLVQ
jgi:hypothetical protein